MGKPRIIVEATGGDKGYGQVKIGAERAIERAPGLEVFFAAGKDKLKEQGYLTDRGELTEEAIPNGMDRDHIILTERTFYYPDKLSWDSSSIYRAIDMHHAREVDAVIAPGDTYPTVYRSFYVFRHNRIGKVRPAIAVDFFGDVLIDAGANESCKAKNYFQFAIMGKVISEYKLGIKDPLVGVVTNGTEDWKGDETARDSLPLLKKLRDKGYNLPEGFLEPNVLKSPERKGFRSGLVLVTNGLVGNALLKMAETSFEIAGDLTRLAYEEEPWWSRIPGGITFKRIRDKLKGKVDYRSFGAAPLFGLDGNVMVGHGRSDAGAIENAIYRTADYLTYNLNDRLREELERCGA